MQWDRQHAVVAAHRFGLGERDLETVGQDPRAWLLAQIGAADAALGAGLPDAATVIATARAARMARREIKAGDDRSADQVVAEQFRGIVQADLRSRMLTASLSERPFAERIVGFWTNHFTVSNAKGTSRGMSGCFEREAIRPHIAGDFRTLLGAATTHAAMLRYLDNSVSAGPRSRVVARLAGREVGGFRITGLNENLARELLELHTLGVDGGYTQADVTALAAVLTGWRAPEIARGDAASGFDPAWHEPGPKRLLGITVPEGPEGLDRVLDHLARHPSTARHIATKMARHWVSDTPPPALVDRLARVYQRDEGNLASVYRELVEAPEAWQPAAAKLRTPEEFVVASARLLRLGPAAFERAPDGGARLMGQSVQAAPSPAGWPDTASEWLGPDAIWKRLEWTTRLADRVGRREDARALASTSLGPRLTPATAQAVARAADGPQALALLLMSPEFQRR